LIDPKAKPEKQQKNINKAVAKPLKNFPAASEEGKDVVRNQEVLPRSSIRSAADIRESDLTC